MEEVIEEGPWLFQGQPVVLQQWEQGMSLRRQKHTKAPVWIRIRHLPMEYWTEDGLSAVASGVGTPLYTDKITKNCLRLDFARVCVMLDFHSKLPKHLVVLSPVLSKDKHTPIKVDIKYEWLPLRCKQCCSLGYTAPNCPETKVTKMGIPMAVYVQKQQVKSVDPSHKRDDEVEATCVQVERDVEPGCTTSYGKIGGNVAAFSTTSGRNIPSPPGPSLPLESECNNKGKEIIVYNSFEILAWNVRGLNSVAHQHAVGQLVRDHDIHFLGILETRIRRGNVQQVQARSLPGWSWIDDYAGPGGRIWIAWNDLEVGVEILRTDEQFIHCSLLNKCTSTKCLITVVYGDCDSIWRRRLWEGLHSLAEDLTEDPWGVLGDFNAVLDMSESCGRSSENTNAMAEFWDFITEVGLTHLPFTRCPYTWHNCSEGSRSLWRRLDRVLVNEICKINARRAKQRVYQIQNFAGQLVSDSEQVAGEFLAFFQSLLGGTRQRRPINLDFLEPHLQHTLTVEEANALLLPVTEAKIRAAFFDISEESAPGPDGYTSAFFKAAWPEIGTDICAAVTEFFVSGRLLK
ncbi:UNVERIFIED_CONTAM: hypothetical protein Slati_4586300 [Sesamum latifolium]|uniref:DUF4283 domain-containing protein n=1 Tax=Sesamum latifolium TaxID=2727402 RepID=A0AAW2S2R3_9LAMI